MPEDERIFNDINKKIKVEGIIREKMPLEYFLKIKTAEEIEPVPPQTVDY